MVLAIVADVVVAGASLFGAEISLGTDDAGEEVGASWYIDPRTDCREIRKRKKSNKRRRRTRREGGMESERAL